ncbi:hypothetical protein AQUCO_00300497v1, partial [Aquilegia coerulea]
GFQLPSNHRNWIIKVNNNINDHLFKTIEECLIEIENLLTTTTITTTVTTTIETLIEVKQLIINNAIKATVIHKIILLMDFEKKIMILVTLCLFLVENALFLSQVQQSCVRDENHTDNGGHLKLFIANVPRRAIEDDIRPLFEEHGNVVEIYLIKDKISGQRRGCCFVKYSSLEDAERAIKALHSQYTFPGILFFIITWYMNYIGSWSFLSCFSVGTDERKVYVAGLNKQATENEIAEIFSTYGRVEDVCILRDNMKQSLGRGFVEFVQRDMVLAAINALNGTYVMTGCDQPLIVRFAHPRKPKAGESRNDAAFRGSGIGPRVHTSLDIRPESNDGSPISVAHTQPNGWIKTSSQSSGPSSQAHDFASHSIAKNGAAPVRIATSSKHPVIEVPSGGQLLPLEKPLHPSLQFPPSLLSHTQITPCTSQMQASHPPTQQLDQLQIPSSVGPCSQALPSEHLNGNRKHSTQCHSHQSTFAAAAQLISLNVQTKDEPSTASQKQLCGPAILQKPLQKSSNQLAEVLTPQLSQTATQEPRSDDAIQQSSFTGNMQQAAATTTVVTSSAVSIPPHTWTSPPTCEWSEHTCPDGFKYYYNCLTKESRWEKPKELIFSKEQQQKLPVQLADIQSRVQKLLISIDSACQMHLTATSSTSRGRYNGSGQSADFSNRDRGFYWGSSSGANRVSYGNSGCGRRDQRGDWNREKQNGDTQSYGWSKGDGDDQLSGWGIQGSGNNRTSDSGWNKGKPHGDDQSSGWSKDANVDAGDQVGGWGNQGSGNNRTSDSGWNKGKPRGDDQSSGWSKDANTDARDQVGGWDSQGAGNNRTSDSGWNKGKPHGDDQSSGWSKDANADAGDQVGGWGSQLSGNNRTSDSGGNKGKPHGEDQSSGWSKDANTDSGDQVGGWGSQVSGNKDTCNSDWKGEKPHVDNKSFGWRTQISGNLGTSNCEGCAGKQIDNWNQSNVTGKTVLAGWNKTIGAKGETNKSGAQADDVWGKAIMNSWGKENSGSGGKGGW